MSDKTIFKVWDVKSEKEKPRSLLNIGSKDIEYWFLVHSNSWQDKFEQLAGQMNLKLGQIPCFSLPLYEKAEILIKQIISIYRDDSRSVIFNF